MRVEYSNLPSFGALWSNQEFNKTQLAVIKHIKKELNTTNKYFKNKSPMNWLSEKGVDLFVSKGSSDKSVKIELVKKVKNPNRIESVHWGHIGEYSNEQKFNPYDIKNVITDITPTTILGVATAIMLLCGIIISPFSTKKPKQAKQNIEQVTKIITDSVKKIPPKTISPWK